MSEATTGARVSEGRRKPLLGAVIVLAVVGSCVLLIYVWRTDRHRAEAESLHKKLAELFADQSTPPVRQGDLTSLFVALMHNPDGRSALTSLARANKWIAYHEARHTVYYVFRDPSGVEGGKQRYLSTVDRVTIDPAKASDWSDQFGCGFPNCITLNGVKVEGNQFWIDFETPSDPQWLDYLDTVKLEPAAKYRVTYDVTPTRLKPKQLFKDARRQ